MHKSKTLSLRAAIVLAWGLGVTATASAEEFTTTLSGYGTVGGTFTSDKNFAYHHDPDEFTGASNTLDIGLDSRLGVQVVFDFGNGISVTAQELAKERGDKSFDLDTEWAYLQYQPTSDFKFRLGRVVTPTFLLSDSRNVGYAAPWFRAPNELYGIEPFQNFDGGQALWHRGVGPVAVSLQTGYGTTQTTLLLGGNKYPIKANYVFNASATLEYGGFLVRASQTKISTPLTIPLSASYAVTFNAVDKFTAFGAQYDNGKAIVLGEWAKRSQNTGPGLPLPVGESTSWYLTGGWRFGEFTPMVMYGKLDEGTTLLAPAGNFGTWSGILRYDIARNIALKAQVSRAQAANYAYWVTEDTTSTERVNVYSIGADFAF
jgi:hypothetical protein